MPGAQAGVCAGACRASSAAPWLAVLCAPAAVTRLRLLHRSSTVARAGSPLPLAVAAGLHKVRRTGRRSERGLHVVLEPPLQRGPQSRRMTAAAPRDRAAWRDARRGAVVWPAWRDSRRRPRRCLVVVSGIAHSPAGRRPDRVRSERREHEGSGRRASFSRPRTRLRPPARRQAFVKARLRGEADNSSFWAPANRGGPKSPPRDRRNAGAGAFGTRLLVPQPRPTSHTLAGFAGMYPTATARGCARGCGATEGRGRESKLGSGLTGWPARLPLVLHTQTYQPAQGWPRRALRCPRCPAGPRPARGCGGVVFRPQGAWN